MHAQTYYICPYDTIYVQCGRGNTDIPRHSIPWYPMISHGFMAPRCDQQNMSTTCRHDSSCVRSYCFILFSMSPSSDMAPFFKSKKKTDCCNVQEIVFVRACIPLYIYIHLACVLNSPGRENKSWRQNRSLEVLASGAHRSHHVALHQPNSYHPRDMPKLCTCQHG